MQEKKKKEIQKKRRKGKERGRKNAQ